MYKCRTNTLQLNNINSYIGRARTCDICNAEEEDLKYFILWCPGYIEKRKRLLSLQQPYTEAEKNVIEKFLFDI